MKKSTGWEIRAKNYTRAGCWTWTTVKTFSNPKAADEWLMTYIRENRLVGSDYTIRTVEH